MLVALQLAVQIGIVAALIQAAWRGRVAKALAALGLVCLAVGLASIGSEARILEVTHQFSAFERNTLTQKDFLIETVEAAAPLWLLACAGFLLVWAFGLWALRPRPGRERGRMHPFWVPMLLAWSSTGLVFGLEKCAAPAGFFTFAPLDRFLFPATVGAAFLLAVRCGSLILTLSWLSLFVTLTRLPIALFGTFATRGKWGTSLDVHSIEHFANPIVQRTVSVEPGSTEQLAWLIWGPHLLVFPALYMMSASGVAFSRWIIERGKVKGH